MTIGERIRKERERLDLSQTELAEKIGISKQTLYKYENNIITNIPSSKIEELAQMLNVSPSFLMGWNTTINQNQDEIIVKKNSQESLVIKEMSKMNQRGKNKLLNTAREMNYSPLYNDNFQQTLSAAHERTDIEVTEEMRKHDDAIMMDDSFWE